MCDLSEHCNFISLILRMFDTLKIISQCYVCLWDGLFIFLSIKICIYVCVCTPEEEIRCSEPYFLGSWSLTEPGANTYKHLYILQSLPQPQSCAARDVYDHAWPFMWLLGILIQVLKSLQVLLAAELGNGVSIFASFCHLCSPEGWGLLWVLIFAFLYNFQVENPSWQGFSPIG